MSNHDLPHFDPGYGSTCAWVALIAAILIIAALLCVAGGLIQ